MWESVSMVVGFMALMQFLMWEHPIDHNIRKAKDQVFMNNLYM